MAFRVVRERLFKTTTNVCAACFQQITPYEVTDACWTCRVRAHSRDCMSWQPLRDYQNNSLTLGYICRSCAREREES